MTVTDEMLDAAAAALILVLEAVAEQAKPMPSDVCRSGRHSDEWVQHGSSRRTCGACARIRNRNRYWRDKPTRPDPPSRRKQPLTERIIDTMQAWRYDHASWTTRQVAARLDADVDHVKRSLYRLESAGFVTRQTRPYTTDDTRIVWQLTPKGETW